MSRFGFAWVLLIGVLLGPSPARAATPAISPEVESALLLQEWEQVHQLLTADDMAASDPVARLLVAHASLATNRNNEATLLFLALRNPKDAEACQAWASRFAGEHPEAAVAHYLAGDAHARLGQAQEGGEAFEAAVKLDPGFALAVSARGVARMVNGDRDGALLDLQQATELAPSLADAHANLGTVWVLEGAAEGAFAAFDKALARDPSFALAYNGRGCARFGSGDYDGAIQDFDHVSDLCPPLLAAGANEAVVLAALSVETNPGDPTKVPGATVAVQSSTREVDYTQFRTAADFQQFDQLVNQTYARSPVEALQLLSTQRANVRTTLADTTTTMAQRSAAVTKADDLRRTLEMTDRLLELVPTSGRLAIVPMPGEGWKRVVDLGRVGLAPLSMGGEAGRMVAEVGRRTLDDPAKALLRTAAYLLAEDAGMLSYIGRTEIGTLRGRATLLQRFDYDLGIKQNEMLARAVNQGVDFSKVDLARSILGPTLSRPLGPVPEYKIASTAPLTQFPVLPGAIGRDIASPGKTPLVVVSGTTDAARLGAMLQRFEAGGVKTLPAPSGMDPQAWARTVGADRLVRITSDPYRPSQAYHLATPRLSGLPPPGGVSTQEIARAYIDRGKWPVLTTFVLAYGGPMAASSPP